MFDQTKDLLTKICHKLSGGHWFGQGSLNYAVDVKLFHEKTNLDLNELETIKKLIPNSVVGGINKSNLSELLSELTECFEFIGDECSFPNKSYLLSKEFKNDLNALLEELKMLFTENIEISKFWLKEGHPFYPVYWDYAFLIKKSENVFVLIGSSSD